jgi:hypothetical protein
MTTAYDVTQQRLLDNMTKYGLQPADRGSKSIKKGSVPKPKNAHKAKSSKGYYK